MKTIATFLIILLTGLSFAQSGRDECIIAKTHILIDCKNLQILIIPVTLSMM